MDKFVTKNASSLSTKSNKSASMTVVADVHADVEAPVTKKVKQENLPR